MKKWLLFLAMALLAGWLVWMGVFGWMVPKTAVFTKPGKWNLVPLRQKQEIVHAYLGTPSSAGNRVEEWTGGTHNRQYLLRIYYGADTTVIAYSVHYIYRSFLVNKKYLIDSSSVR
jgi:hypothetical protein